MCSEYVYYVKPLRVVTHQWALGESFCSAMQTEAGILTSFESKFLSIQV